MTTELIAVTAAALELLTDHLVEVAMVGEAGRGLGSPSLLLGLEQGAFVSAIAAWAA